MSDSNGATPSPILSLEASRAIKTRKGNDFITVQQAYDMVIQECAKVHEHYLAQLPHFTARMIQDALLTYGLIVPQPGSDIVPDGMKPEDIPAAQAAVDAAIARGDLPPADPAA